MLKGKTIVLPCHALSFLSHADWIISLADGHIVEQGTYRGLLNAGNDFTTLMQEHASVSSDTQDEKRDTAKKAEKTAETKHKAEGKKDD